MNLPLESSVALITGAAHGIGRATSIELARRGAAVALLDIDDASSVARSIADFGGEAICLHGDVRSEEQLESAFSKFDRWSNRLNIVVNNAGILVEGRLAKMSTEDFDNVLAVNLRGAFLVGRAAVQRMRIHHTESDKSECRIINVASELAQIGRAEYTAYCASKGGIIAMTRAWAREFAPGILVNAVAPGPVDTAMLGLESMSPEWREKEIDIPLGRLGTPDEIANTIAFLAGPESRFYTGQVLGPNGGAAMY
ncbi:MAG: SDR family oxidoreductase [Albidovulum sp.]|nr:SDR family oxidoreductase [Albidovulum sp.]